MAISECGGESTDVCMFEPPCMPACVHAAPAKISKMIRRNMRCIDGVRLNKTRSFYTDLVFPPLEQGRVERGLPLVCVCDGVFVCVCVCV